MQVVQSAYCYGGGTLGWLLMQTVVTPLTATFISFGVSALYGNDFAWTIFAIGTSINALVAYFVNQVAKIPRPELLPFACQSSSFGLPDVAYVSTLSAVLLLAAMSLHGQTRVRLLSGVLMLAYATLYTAAMWFNNYMSVAQICVSLGMALTWTSVWFQIYVDVLHPISHTVKNHWVLRWLFNDSLMT